MARKSGRQSFLAAALAAAAALALLGAASSAFLPTAAPPAALGVAAAAPALLGAAAPALAEEAAKAAEEGGLLNFGKIPLGGGFAINLDIPETGVINIAVLIAGLIYLLGPLLSESMASREKEIQGDIDDAVAKFDEAAARLAEAEKARAQANEVIAEINASIDKDKAEFEATVKAQTEATLTKQAAAAEATLAELQANAGNKVEGYIQEQAVTRGLKELSSMSDKQKSKFMDAAIAAL